MRSLVVLFFLKSFVMRLFHPISWPWCKVTSVQPSLYLYHYSAMYSCSQNPITSSATTGDGSVKYFFNASLPLVVVAACESSGKLWQRSLRTFLACSGMGGLLEQYGRSTVAGLTVGIGACDWKSCRWKTEMVWLIEETEHSVMTGISRPVDWRLGIH